MLSAAKERMVSKGENQEKERENHLRVMEEKDYTL